MSRIVRVVGPAVLTLGLALGARGATWYVSPSGSDSNSGSVSAPFATISKALKSMSGGDTLYLRGGTYVQCIDDTAIQAIPGGSASNPTTIAGYPGDPAAVLEPSGCGRVIHLSNSHYVTFNNLVLDGTNDSSGAEVIKLEYEGSQTSPSSYASYITFEYTEVRNGGGNGILVDWQDPNNQFLHLLVHNNGYNNLTHGFYVDSSNNVIDHCTIYDNAGYGVQIYNGYSGETANNNVISNNVIYGNGSNNVGAGIIMSSGSGDKAFNNVIYGNAGGIFSQYGEVNSLIYNNTIYDNSTGGSPYGIYLGGGSGDSSSGAQVINNIVYDNSGGISNNQPGATVADNVTSNPLFVNAPSSFALQAGSPAIKAGENLYAQGVTTDISGAARPASGPFDVGAYQYGSTGTGGATSGGGTTTTSPTTSGPVRIVRAPTAPTTIVPSGAAGAASGAVGAPTGAVGAAAAGAPSVPAVTVLSGCATGSTAWSNVSFPSQTGAFTIAFTAAPSKAAMTGVIGLSSAKATSYASVAALVRFNSAGHIDLRNGAGYAAAVAYPYSAGLTYRFQVVVNVPAHTYSVLVSEGGGAAVTLGSNYAFRTGQTSLASLSQLALYAKGGTESVCGVTVQSAQ